jgi:hypothetical protein
MAVTIHVNGSSNSLAHKGCSGITKSTIPDVCKTPSPGGPVPIPYPIIVSMSSSLKNGTTTVTVDGGNPAAIKGSEYGSCSGDEAGTAGGVKSSTNMKEATWILYSFDVKLDGGNACRLSDKMMMNHGNAACLGGTLHAPVPLLDSCDKAGLDKLAEDCNKAINCSPKDGGPCPTPPSGNASSNPGGSDCTTLGTKKHKCCEESIKKHAEEHPECGFRSEVGFPEGSNDDAREKAGEVYKAKMDSYDRRGLSKAQARGYCRRDGVYMKAYYANGGPTFRADVLQGNPPCQGFDFKFNCGGKKDIHPDQVAKYEKYTGHPPAQVYADGSKCGCS